MNQSAGATVPGHILFCGGITKATWSDVNPLAAQENGKHTRLTSMLHTSGVLPDITHADNGQFLNVPFLPRLQGRRTGSPGGALGWVWEERPGSLPRRGSGRGRLRTNNFFASPSGAAITSRWTAWAHVVGDLPPALGGTAFENSQVGRTEPIRRVLLPRTLSSPSGLFHSPFTSS